MRFISAIIKQLEAVKAITSKCEMTHLADLFDSFCINNGSIHITLWWEQILWQVYLKPLVVPASTCSLTS